MKKISSGVEFSFRIDGNTVIDIGKKEVLVSDEHAAAARARYGSLVKVEEHKSVASKPKEEVAPTSSNIAATASNEVVAPVTETTVVVAGESQPKEEVAPVAEKPARTRRASNK